MGSRGKSLAICARVATQVHPFIQSHAGGANEGASCLQGNERFCEDSLGDLAFPQSLLPLRLVEHTGPHQTIRLVEAKILTPFMKTLEHPDLSGSSDLFRVPKSDFSYDPRYAGNK